MVLLKLASSPSGNVNLLISASYRYTDATLERLADQCRSNTCAFGVEDSTHC